MSRINTAPRRYSNAFHHEVHEDHEENHSVRRPDLRGYPSSPMFFSASLRVIWLLEHFRMRSADRDQADADPQGVIHAGHGFLVQMGDLIVQALLVDGADLLQEHDGIAFQVVAG